MNGVPAETANAATLASLPPSSGEDAAWFRRILDAIDDLVLVKGDRSRLLWANRSFREYYGMTNEELRDIIDGAHSDPDDTVQYVRDDHRVFTTGKKLDVGSEPVTNGDGETNYFHTVKTPILSDEGDVIATVGVSRRRPDGDPGEGTAPEEQERAARKAGLSELRGLVANIPLPVMMCDSRLRILERSDAWSVWAAEAEPAHNDTFFDEAYGSKIPVTDLLREVIASDGQSEAHGIEAWISEDSARIIDVAARAWRLASGEVGGAVLIVHDVTEVATTQTLLQRANEELTQFNYRASHDLRGPLRTIMGLLNLVKVELGDGDREAAMESLAHAHATAERLSDLVTRLLELARLDAANLDDTETNLGAVVQQIFQEHATDLEASGLAVSMKLECNVIYGARTRIHQTLDNLVSNAIKYLDPSEDQPSLEIRSGQTDDGAWVEVRDNGRGFEKPDQAFELFSRESSGSSGVGLGLHIVKKHVAWLGGRVSITSPRKDTVVRIELPHAPQ